MGMSHANVAVPAWERREKKGGMIFFYEKKGSFKNPFLSSGENLLA